MMISAINKNGRLLLVEAGVDYINFYRPTSNKGQYFLKRWSRENPGRSIIATEGSRSRMLRDGQIYGVYASGNRPKTPTPADWQLFYENGIPHSE